MLSMSWEVLQLWTCLFTVKMWCKGHTVLVNRRWCPAVWGEPHGCWLVDCRSTSRYTLNCHACKESSCLLLGWYRNVIFSILIVSKIVAEYWLLKLGMKVSKWSGSRIKLRACHGHNKIKWHGQVMWWWYNTSVESHLHLNQRLSNCLMHYSMNCVIVGVVCSYCNINIVIDRVLCLHYSMDGIIHNWESCLHVL